MPDPVKSIALLLWLVVETAVVLVLLVGAVTLLLRVFLGKFGHMAQKWKPPARASTANYSVVALLSPAERSFFAVLELAVQSGFRVFAKVRLADIVAPTTGGSRSQWQRNFNRINCKHVDFVLCHRDTLEVAAAVELDDKSHARFDRGLRDAFVDEALGSAQIPVIRVPARSAYSPGELRDLCRNAIANRIGRSLAVRS